MAAAIALLNFARRGKVGRSSLACQCLPIYQVDMQMTPMQRDGLEIDSWQRKKRRHKKRKEKRKRHFMTSRLGREWTEKDQIAASLSVLSLAICQPSPILSQLLLIHVQTLPLICSPYARRRPPPSSSSSSNDTLIILDNHQRARLGIHTYILAQPLQATPDCRFLIGPNLRARMPPTHTCSHTL